MNTPPSVFASLQSLESSLKREIRGQDHVLHRVVSVLRRGQLGLSKPSRPRGSFLFLGPTGVGKTELTLAFTRELFGADRLVRFDMSEFQTQDALGLLLGAKTSEAGFLGEAVARTQQGILLFDEIEKAHPRLMDVFLQMLDAARITVATGQTLDLSRYYVVLTSNLGSAELLNLQHSSEATLERHVLTSAQQALRPEIFARITEKLVFHRLSYEHQLEIADKFIGAELAFHESQGRKIVADGSVRPFLVRKGFHPKLGARPMRDAVEKFVGDAIAENLLRGGDGGGTLTADPAEDALRLSDQADMSTK